LRVDENIFDQSGKYSGAFWFKIIMDSKGFAHGLHAPFPTPKTVDQTAQNRQEHGGKEPAHLFPLGWILTVKNVPDSPEIGSDGQEKGQGNEDEHGG
jgi:hypothetical protein